MKPKPKKPRKKAKVIKQRIDCQVYMAPVLLLANCDNAYVAAQMKKELDCENDPDDYKNWQGGTFYHTPKGAKRTAYVVWVKKYDEETIRHEAQHLAGFIFEHRGVKLSADNEAYNWYCGYWYKVIKTLLKKGG